MRRRAYTRGSVLRIHLTDDSSVEGVYRGRSRVFLELEAGKIEAAGTWVVSRSEALLVPHALVKLVEVVQC